MTRRRMLLLVTSSIYWIQIIHDESEICSSLSLHSPPCLLFYHIVVRVLNNISIPYSVTSLRPAIMAYISVHRGYVLLYIPSSKLTRKAFSIRTLQHLLRNIKVVLGVLISYEPNRGGCNPRQLSSECGRGGLSHRPYASSDAIRLKR